MDSVEENPSNAGTKSIVMGDPCIGKATLLAKLMGDVARTSRSSYEPTTFNKIEWSLKAESGEEIMIDMWDTSGQEGFAMLRKISIEGTELFLLGYSMASQASLENLQEQWYKEVVEYDSHPWIIMIGVAPKLGEVKVVAHDDAKKAAASMCATAYVELDYDSEAGFEQLASIFVALVQKRKAKETRPELGSLDHLAVQKVTEHKVQSGQHKITNEEMSKVNITETELRRLTDLAHKAAQKEDEDAQKPIQNEKGPPPENASQKTITEDAVNNQAQPDEAGCKCIVS